MALPTHILLLYGYLLLFAWFWWSSLEFLCPPRRFCWPQGPSRRSTKSALPGSAGRTGCLADRRQRLVPHRPRYGHHVLRLLCKCRWSPPSACGAPRIPLAAAASHADDRQVRAGLATLAPPVAGENGMAYGRFLFFDAIGATAWLAALLAAGRFFGDLLKPRPPPAGLGPASSPERCWCWAFSASSRPG